jgi:hypothetical protein
MLKALDDLRANDICLNTGSSPRNALWGEMIAIRTQKLGAAGCGSKWIERDTRRQCQDSAALTTLQLFYDYLLIPMSQTLASFWQDFFLDIVRDQYPRAFGSTFAEAPTFGFSPCLVPAMPG